MSPGKLQEIRTARPTAQAEGIFGVYREIREAIKGRIERGEITQQQLSRETGISQPHISNTLSRVRGTRISTLDTLAEAAGIEVTATITAPATGQRAAEPQPPKANFTFTPAPERKSKYDEETDTTHRSRGVAKRSYKLPKVA